MYEHLNERSDKIFTSYRDLELSLSLISQPMDIRSLFKQTADYSYSAVSSGWQLSVQVSATSAR